MTDRKKETLKPAPRAELPYSATVAYESLVFISGKIGRAPNTNAIALGDVYEQTMQTMRNIENDLAEIGLTMDNALKSTVFLTEMRHFPLMNEAYRSFFQDAPPARSCVGVSTLPDPDALVEIEMIVHR